MSGKNINVTALSKNVLKNNNKNIVSSYLVVTNVRVERGDQHERLAHNLGDGGGVGLDAFGAVLVECVATITCTNL